MRSRLLSFSLLTVVIIPALATASVGFERRWHITSSDIGRSVTLSDGGYLVGGRTSDGSGFGAVVLAVGAGGDTIWTRQVSGLDDGGGFLCRLNDGGCAVAGTRDSLVLVQKFTTYGDSAWTYLSPTGGVVNALAPTSDGGCFVAGRIPNPGDDFGLIRLNADGTEAWSRHYHESGVYWTMAFGVSPAGDGGSVLSGTGWDYDNSYARLVRVGIDGETLWTRLYRGSQGASLGDAMECAGGFVAVGSERDTLTYLTTLYAMRTDSTGAVVGNAGLSVSRAVATASAVDVTTDGGFIVAGQLDWGDSTRIWLVRFNADLDTLWTRRFGGPENDIASDVRQTADGGYVIAGTSDSLGSSILLIKTDSLGRVSSGLAEEVRAVPGRIALSVAPNPANGTVHINCSLPAKASLKLYDVSGKLVRNLTAAVRRGLPVTGLAKGVYLLKLEYDGRVTTRKLVVE